ncbi:hypothetical protein ACM66B_004078 [Microbotryomycetes sp. NB124-2]
MSLSSSSLAALKAELSKKEAEFEATKHLGSTVARSSKSTAGSAASTSSRKIKGKGHRSYVDKPNKGLQMRQTRDYDPDNSRLAKTPAHSKQMLEHKAKLYDKIKRGKTAGLTEAQISNLLVDFDQKDLEDDEDEDDNEGDSSDDSNRDDPSDPMVEYTDEYGRVRKVRRSEVPRLADRPDDEPDERNIRYGDQVYFPVYQPDPEVLAARKAAFEESAPLVQHYDASKEVRARGAGFMSFSKDEQVRQQQMDALKRERDETMRIRDRLEKDGGVVGEREREMQDRKRKLELKRAELEAKRKRSN